MKTVISATTAPDAAGDLLVAAWRRLLCGIPGLLLGVVARWIAGRANPAR